VLERYHRTLALLPRTAEIVDTADVHVYDNSVNNKEQRCKLLFIGRDGQFSVAD